MKIATVATGGIGGFLAVKLGLRGHQIATIARGAHLDAISKNGLSLAAPSGKFTIQPWIATDDTSQVGEVDAIIFGVKGDDLEAAAEACKPMLGSDTVVVPFLNGVEASDRLAEILPEANVANGMAQVSTTISAPGLIAQTGDFNLFVFAERDSRPSDRIAALQKALTDAGVSAPETDDIERDLWSKFVLFSAVSGVTAAARCTIADITGIPELAAVFREVVRETAALGRASGVALPDDIETKTWERVQTLPPSMRASTAIDVEHGRPLEIEWISGAAARMSEKAGLDAPMNRTLYAVLLPHKAGL
ncbi:ketopantoate reductase family protein [Yoonia sediminilitoris]|uniref:2-dehydropantoate 2-reductase n=1 Tax=Yoonia sediminilitoris TaxID=1286148 RepID=A0A2T6KAI3_9RHOB|nr:2-dehydropantoate 2-reductase [Yoonia sediminilitoris]PUB11857.1 ketopantoate reductase [Yoonia sediminilitoris]RCW91934.1 ketopantoate reductase [Yoonia sediminilitoris]